MYEDAYDGDRDQQLERLLSAGAYEQALQVLEAWYEREPWNAEVLMRMAVAHWLAGQPALTLRDLDALLTMEPDNAEALARRAQALLMLGKGADAEATLERAEAIDPSTPGVLLNRALIHETHEEYLQAIDKLSAYLDAMPVDHLARARRSHLWRTVGQYDRALEDALITVGEHPEDPETHFAEALARVTLEQGDEALAACDKALQVQGTFLPALRLKVDLLADLGRLDEAEMHLALLEAQDPLAAPTALLHARVAAEREHYDEALTWVGRYMDDAPDEPYAYYRRGMIYQRMREFARALEDFQEYARLAPHALEAYEQQFMCYLEMARYDDAARVGAQAVTLQPENYRLQYNRAYAELLLGHTEPALAGFAESAALDPENEDLLLRIHLALVEHTPPAVRIAGFRAIVARIGERTPMAKGLLAELLLEAGEQEEPWALAQQVMAMDPKRAFGYLLGVKALCLMDHYPQALGVASEGVEQLPDDGRLRLARALVLRDLGLPDEAMQELEIAGLLLPGEAEVVRQQALVHGSTGEIGEAVRLLREAVTLDPQYPEGYFWLGYFLVHLQEYREALEAADTLLALVPAAPEGRLVRGVALRGLKKHREADAELERAAEADAALVARLCADPVIAELVAAPKKRGMRERLRRSVRQGWMGLLATVGLVL